MTQGKIERWHLTLKNCILLENYYLPDDLEAQIEAFVADYNHHRYHESIDQRRPTSTSDADRPSCCREKGSHDRPSPNAVESVCHSWFGAAVLSLNSSAAFITMKAGLAIRSWALSGR